MYKVSCFWGSIQLKVRKSSSDVVCNVHTERMVRSCYFSCSCVSIFLFICIQYDLVLLLFLFFRYWVGSAVFLPGVIWCIFQNVVTVCPFPLYGPSMDVATNTGKNFFLLLKSYATILMELLSGLY